MSKIYDMTERVAEIRTHFAALLEKKLDHIAALSGVNRSCLIPINPADFIDRVSIMRVLGHQYISIGKWIAEHKRDGIYLISPLDADRETANQIMYKEHETTERIRASKCSVVPISREMARAFFIRNHRQSLPHLTVKSLSYALVYRGAVKAVMTYDFTAGAIRGRSNKDKYELLRLAIARGTQVNGGASRLQKHCEQAILHYGITKIISYSNATINNGGVYQKLGFTGSRVTNGAPYMVDKANRLLRLAEFIGQATNAQLLCRGRIKTRIGGNRLWVKSLTPADGDKTAASAPLAT